MRPGIIIARQSLPLWDYPSSSRDSLPRSSYASHTHRTLSSPFRLPHTSSASVGTAVSKQASILIPAHSPRPWSLFGQPPRAHAKHPSSCRTTTTPFPARPTSPARSPFLVRIHSKYCACWCSLTLTAWAVARVKKIIQADEDINACSANAAFAIAVATEEFVYYLTEQAHKMCKAEKKPKRSLAYTHVRTSTRIHARINTPQDLKLTYPRASRCPPRQPRISDRRCAQDSELQRC